MKKKKSRRHSIPTTLPVITLTSFTNINNSDDGDEEDDVTGKRLEIDVDQCTSDPRHRRHVHRQLCDDEIHSNNDDESERDRPSKWRTFRRMSDRSVRQFVDHLRKKEHRHPRHMSVDFTAADVKYLPMTATGILKAPSQSNFTFSFAHIQSSEHRKSVSFSDQDNVKVYSSSDDNNNLNDEDDETINDDQIKESKDLLDIPKSDEMKKNLVPTFVLPKRKPNFASVVRRKVLILETLDVCPDELTVLGIIRVNLSKLRQLETKEQKKNGQKVSVGVTYSTDDWNSHMNTKAMMIRPSVIKPHPQLTDIECVFMRFSIDLEELEIGDTVNFYLYCVDKIQTTNPVKYEDTNDGSYYKIKCTSYLNPWAAKAAQQLNNFVPTVRYNKNFISNC